MSDSEVESNAGSDAGAGEEEEEFIVEKILQKRIVKGKIEYFLKWKNFGDADNTWEPEENCGCPELIAEFERQLEEKEKKKKEAVKTPAKKAGPASSKVPEERKDKRDRESSGGDVAASKKPRTGKEAANSSRGASKPAEVTGFDRGLTAEKIIGATDSSGELMFLVKWKDTDEADLVPSRQANVKCPQIVIAFYEERLTWNANDIPNGD